MNTDFVVGISEKATNNLNMVFNTEIGQKYLINKKGFEKNFINRLPEFGFSTIANILASIKIAKYMNLSSNDAIITVATDGADLYLSELDRTKEEFIGIYDEFSCAEIIGQYLKGATTDNTLELNQREKERIFNLGYYTWVEQQNIPVEEFNKREDPKFWKNLRSEIKEWDELTDDDWVGNAKYSEDVAARKQITGQEYWQGSQQQEIYPLEANRNVVLTESWLNVDRDGDGIAELKHIISVGNIILQEEDIETIPLASIVPIDIPFEFYGLSMADFTRSSTLASTAILRGFVENTYLTNYSPKLADPNVVDFSALQNMKPKQIIPTNGNPVNAVQQLPPETISTGTVPLLEYIQLIKEQATGMSKAAQGLNDTLYISGNSEQKLQAVQSAAQKRIQHIARRFAETGFKKLVAGVYETMHKNMKGEVSYNLDGVY